ncbi:hypothetical protein FJTKL_01253 [Diaporthe vaccinii]|uniref:Uncharacterized protein n=1 Tax=Diaporthe vaccinii TaxID=105482 RepID=A0ABR4E1A9_9PEZI
MPDFYAVPYPTGQDPGQVHPRRSRTVEYRRLIADPCRGGKLSLEGYRWAAYLYGGETCISLRTYTTTTRYDSLLSRRQGDCAAFRQALAEEDYNGMPDRDVEYNIYVPHDLLPDYPIGRAITETQARNYLSQFPIPLWINRDSPLYRDWHLNTDTWKGEQSLDDLGLTADSVYRHMPSTPPSLTSSNPPSPFSYGPPPSDLHRGTPRNRNHNHNHKMPLKEQARNTRGRFVRQEKNVMVNPREATAVIFAAAALTHISENPDLYPAEWITGAKTNKAAILSLANKVNQTADGLEPESPAEVLRRLQLDSAAATPSCKRTATASLLGDEEEDQLVYKSGILFKKEDNPFASPAKKTDNTTRSEKSNPSAIATLLENKEYFKSVAIFMSKFGDITNLSFDPRCPAIEDLRAGRPISSDSNVTITGSLERIHVVFIHDRFTTGSLIPSTLLEGLDKAANSIQNADPDNLTDQVPISFILHAMLRMNRDFGVVRLRYTNDNYIDKGATIDAWKTRYASALDHNSKETMCRRVAGLVDYVKNHGVVKCHALTDQEVDLITAGVADDTVDALWGDGVNHASGRGPACDID